MLLKVHRWPDGSVHEGQCKGKKRHGLGAQWDKDGKLVKCGRWTNHKFVEACAVPMRLLPEGCSLSAAALQAKRDHPDGSALFENGSHYVGSLNAEGQPHGQGASFHPDGSPQRWLIMDGDASQSGRWIGGKHHGRATEILSNGDRYEGLFKDSLREGVGSYIWQDEGRYEGEWAAGKKSGLGAQWNKDGKLTLCGRWVDGKLVKRCAVPLRLLPEGKYLSDAALQAKRDHPDGSALLLHGSHYIGPLVQGQPHGQGASFHPDGSPESTLQVDEDPNLSGRWVDGKLNGRATQTYDNGRYEGQLKDGLREGLGVYDWKDGSRFEGEWIGGYRSGLGATWNKDGKLAECGRWADSKLVAWCAVPLRMLPEGKWLSAAALQVKRDHPNASALLSDGSHYVGQLNKLGQPDGPGASFHPDGSPRVTLIAHESDASQSGRWVDGKLHGRATRSLPFGRRDDGLFQSGQLHGLGERTMPDGVRYEGEFVEDKRSGQGVEWGRNGNLVKCGRWDSDQLVTAAAVPLQCLPQKRFLSPHAKIASLLFPDGGYFVGPINAQNQRHGEGSMFSARGGLCQVGMWVSDVLQTRKALLIGNDNYELPVSSLHCCVNDANGIRCALQELRFACTIVTNANRREMTNAITAFIASLQPGDLVFIFCAGHGADEDGNTYLIPTDFKSGTYQHDAVGLNWILRDLNRKSCNLTSIIVLDCCSADDANVTFRGPPHRVSPSALRLPSSGSFFVVKASDPGTVACESRDERYGWYTSCLLLYLTQPGLRLTEIFMKTRKALLAKSKGTQCSWDSNTLVEDIVLKPIR